MSTDLIPSYLESDFDTSFQKLKNFLENSDTFKDYNFQGANITMIMQLMSYLADFNSYYTNMVAKNIYTDTADIYETVHRLVTQKGYQPLGYISSQATVTITISGNSSVISEGDQIYIEPWQEVDTTQSIDNNKLFYTMTEPSTTTVDVSGSYEFDIKLREGVIDTLNYRGEDIIDNSIILPFKNYDHGKFPFDIPSILLTVNDTEWTRIDEFYEEVTGLYVNDNVYRLVYDKYNRYTIQFSSSRNTPINTDDIVIKLLISNGVSGVIASGIINKEIYPNTFKIYNITKGNEISEGNIIEFVNNEASIPGSQPESVQDIKINSEASTHSQYRNITKKDYKSHIESRTDVIKGYAWGEQEVDPGNTIEYNRVYFSVIPPYGTDTYFINGTILCDDITWNDSDNPSISGDIAIPSVYNTDYHNNLLKFLEPRKMLNVYEIPVLPELVYFRFNIGIRVKRTFDYIMVQESVKNKLNYFFDSINRSYNEKINFMDIHNFVMDIGITTESDDFSGIKGVDNLVIREIKTYTPSISGNEEFVYEPNSNFDYPQYTQNTWDSYIDNMLRPIKLGFNQFPTISIDMCTFTSEI